MANRFGNPPNLGVYPVPPPTDWSQAQEEPDPTANPYLYALMSGAGDDDSQALQDVLRKRGALGTILAASGSKALAPMGKAMVQEAGEAPALINQGRKLKLALEQQKAQAADHQLKMGLDERRLSEMERHNRALEAKQNDLTGGLFGIKDDQAEAIADAISKGQQPPDMKGMYSLAGPVKAKLATRGYDLSKATLDWAATTKFLATANNPQQLRLRQAITFTRDTLPKIEALYDRWLKLAPTTGFKRFNRTAVSAAKAVGGEIGSVALNLEARINDLTSELGNVYMGGNSPTDHSLKLAAQNLSADWDEKAFKDAIKRLQTDLTIRENSIRTAEPITGAGGGQYYTAPPVAAPPGGGAAHPGAHGGGGGAAPPVEGAVKSKSGRWMKKNDKGQWEYLE